MTLFPLGDLAGIDTGSWPLPIWAVDRRDEFGVTTLIGGEETACEFNLAAPMNGERWRLAI
jgi:hypothetical protein